jgi:hypothetical protein
MRKRKDLFLCRKLRNFMMRLGGVWYLSKNSTAALHSFCSPVSRENKGKVSKHT